MLYSHSKWNSFNLFPVSATSFYVSLQFFKSISNNYIHHEKKTKQSFLAQGLSNHTATNLVTDIHDVERDKRQGKTYQRLVELPDYSSKNSSWKF